MKNNLICGITRAASKVKFTAIKKSPELCMAGAVIGLVGAMIEVGHATTKLDKIMEPVKEELNKLHEVHDNPEMLPEGAEYSESDYRKDLGLTYFKAGVSLAKLYFPAVLLGGLSISCIIGGHNIMKSRNLALAAAYEACDKAFKTYRNRVTERFGEAVEQEIRYNIKNEQFEETIVDDKGKEKTVKTSVPIADPGLEGYSEYAKFFDESCDQWEDDSEYNHSFLVRAENEFNNRLRANGRVFLNEVYRYLGIPETKAGQIVGWVWNSNAEFADNRIDFGIHDINRPRVRDFVNGYEKVILLDFNVQGNIWANMN